MSYRSAPSCQASLCRIIKNLLIMQHQDWKPVVFEKFKKETEVKKRFGGDKNKQTQIISSKKFEKDLDSENKDVDFKIPKVGGELAKQLQQARMKLGLKQ